MHISLMRTIRKLFLCSISKTVRIVKDIKTVRIVKDIKDNNP